MISHIGCVISNIAERDLIRMPSNFNKRGQYLMNQLNTHQNHSDRIIRETECRHMTGLCRTTRYLMEKKGIFRRVASSGAFCRVALIGNYHLAVKPT